MRSRGHITGGGSSPGSVLVEVMVALVVAALLLVPLAEAVGSALSRSERVRDQVRAEEEARAAASTWLGAWTWGPQVVDGCWGAGPVLDVRVAIGDGEAIVGLWVDGWFCGERVPDGDLCLSVGASEWRDRAGAELVVRVREAEDVWGPPWRSLVPDITGRVPGPDSAVATEASLCGAGSVAESLAHVPSAANPAVQISWSDGDIQADANGWPLRLPECTAGLCTISLEGRSQSWRKEAGRVLDIYF